MEPKVFLIDEKEYHNSHACNFQKKYYFQSVSCFSISSE